LALDSYVARQTAERNRGHKHQDRPHHRNYTSNDQQRCAEALHRQSSPTRPILVRRFRAGIVGWIRGVCVAAHMPVSQFVEPTPQLGLKATIDRLVVVALDAEVILVTPAFGTVMRVLVALAMSEPLRTRIARIA